MLLRRQIARSSPWCRFPRFSSRVFKFEEAMIHDLAMCLAYGAEIDGPLWFRMDVGLALVRVLRAMRMLV